MLCTTPRTRSGLSSSITIRRVWPEETQRCSASSTDLGGVDGDHRRDRRHHLARLLLVQVEDARRASPPRRGRASRRSRLADDRLHVLGGVLLLELARARRRTAARSRSRSSSRPTVNGALRTRNALSGRARAAAVASGAGDREHLRHLLADRDVDRGHERERDRHGDRRRRRRARARRRPAPAGAASAGSPRKPIPIEAIVMPDLARGQVLVDAVDLGEGQLGAPACRPWRSPRAAPAWPGPARTPPPRTGR